MKTEILTIRVSAEMKEHLQALAKATERTPAYLAKEALEEYLRSQEWQIRAIQAGVEEAQHGGLASNEDVTSVFGKVGVSYGD